MSVTGEIQTDGLRKNGAVGSILFKSPLKPRLLAHSHKRPLKSQLSSAVLAMESLSILIDIEV